MQPSSPIRHFAAPAIPRPTAWVQLIHRRSLSAIDLVAAISVHENPLLSCSDSSPGHPGHVPLFYVPCPGQLAGHWDGTSPPIGVSRCPVSRSVVRPGTFTLEGKRLQLPNLTGRAGSADYFWRAQAISRNILFASPKSPRWKAHRVGAAVVYPCNLIAALSPAAVQPPLVAQI